MAVYAMDSRVKASYVNVYYGDPYGTNEYELYGWGWVDSDVYHYTSCSCTYKGSTLTSDRLWGYGQISKASPAFTGLTFYD